MPDALPAGPYKTVALEDGTPVPYYIIEFDKNGQCMAPETRRHLLAQAGQYTDIYLFSHGWNNDWPTASKRYDSFYAGFSAMRKEFNLPAPVGYRPLMVGIIWPGVVLVGTDGHAPAMAGGDPFMESQSVIEIEQAVAPEELTELQSLLKSTNMDQAGALALARILRPLYRTATDEVGAELPSEAALIDTWVGASGEADKIPDAGDAGVADDDLAPDDVASPKPAGWLGKLADLARGAVRVTTVWMMKDRAGVVGTIGVGPLLNGLLDAGQARLHLVGHSYGAKVVLSALCAAKDMPRKVHSVLLLQGAVSHLCFADRVPGLDIPGGYRPALERTELPILATYSSHDISLTKLFQVALRRDGDLGDIRIGGPISRFAALGGYGPHEASEQTIVIQSPPSPYMINPGVRVVGLLADAAISGHGDISNAATWWALHSLVK
jgi:hypothetical protein